MVSLLWREGGGDDSDTLATGFRGDSLFREGLVSLLWREGVEDGSDITGSISGSLVREGEGVFSDSQATFVSDLLATFWDMQGSMESKCLGV